MYTYLLSIHLIRSLKDTAEIHVYIDYLSTHVRLGHKVENTIRKESTYDVLSIQRESGKNGTKNTRKRRHLQINKEKKEKKGRTKKKKETRAAIEALFLYDLPYVYVVLTNILKQYEYCPAEPRSGLANHLLVHYWVWLRARSVNVKNTTTTTTTVALETGVAAPPPLRTKPEHPENMHEISTARESRTSFFLLKTPQFSNFLARVTSILTWTISPVSPVSPTNQVHEGALRLL